MKGALATRSIVVVLPLLAFAAALGQILWGT
jgi:hypothetical protein